MISSEVYIAPYMRIDKVRPYAEVKKIRKLDENIAE
jgi:hypothetical protein